MKKYYVVKRINAECDNLPRKTVTVGRFEDLEDAEKYLHCKGAELRMCRLEEVYTDGIDNLFILEV